MNDMSTSNPPRYAPTPRTKAKRLKKRATYDRDAVHAILDAGTICHVGFALNDDPFVIPTIYARAGETLYFHGAMASRTLQALAKGIEVCLTVTLLDGLVLARSAFHHSMNYRSVMVFGTARLVNDETEKLQALQCLTDHVVPRRWDEVRQPNSLELRQTSVLALPLQEVSAKVRSGNPVDDDEDYALPIWAGVVAIRQPLLAPVDDGRLANGAPAMDLRRFDRAPVTN
jgi:nitroimidazol reductase NimA-like FMN-containing flavoprotein (pyridoxamine 5'-phosphate oxidase superfamily)